MESSHQTQGKNGSEPRSPTPTLRPDVVATIIAVMKAELVEEMREAIRQEARAFRKPKQLLNIEDVAEWLNVSVRTVEKLVAEKKIVPIRVRGLRRFSPEAIEAYLRKNAGRRGKR